MKEVILAKCGELVLKGLNRRNFEAVLIKNLKRRLQLIGDFNVSIAQSTVYVEANDDTSDIDLAFEKVLQVFGLVAAVKAVIVKKDLNTIFEAICSKFGENLSESRTFKVNSRRSDKSFPMASPEICATIGGDILRKYSNLSVDVHKPDIIINIEIREKGAYIHTGQISAAGGVPVGTSGRVLLMLSGGIDSPVAGYMMAKRGLEVSSIHFESPPYTSERARQKVVSLANIISPYTGRHQLYMVPFTKIQEELYERCKNDFFTVVMRRYMLKIAERIANTDNFGGIVTGESIAQVASQTLHAIACTDASINLPILRPLIGMDKEEIIKISRKIGTFDVSTLPYEDCCTVFTPRHPRTKPKLSEVENIEQKIQLPEELIEECIRNIEIIDIDLH